MEKKEFMKFIELILKSSGMNVTAPAVLTNKWAKECLTFNGESAWCDIQIAMSNLSEEDTRNIIKLIVHRYCRMLEVCDLLMTIMEESREIASYVSEHPEYKDHSTSFSDELEKLLDSMQ